MHGQEGKSAWNNLSIKKIVPDSKGLKTNSSFINVQYSSKGRQGEVTKTLFEPGYPLLRGPHKTVTFIIQWLHINGIKKIIFAGNDLAADTFENKYAYKLESYDMRKKGNFKKTLDQVEKTLRIWYPVALQKGFEWYSWKCGHVFESIVPKFTEEMEKEYMAKKTKKKTESIPKPQKEKLTPVQKILKETTNNFKNVVDSTLSVNENEWKERCKLYNERLRKGI